MSPRILLTASLMTAFMAAFAVGSAFGNDSGKNSGNNVRLDKNPGFDRADSIVNSQGINPDTTSRSSIPSGPIPPSPRRPDTTVVYAVIGDSLELRLDLFLPGRVETPDGPRQIVHADGARWPLIIWIHGGGWRGGSRTDPSPALALLDSGFAVANIDYRLSRRALWPAQLHDAKAAVRWLRAHADTFGLDTARFVAWGTSAGAHLAAMLGVTTPADSLEGTVGDHPGVSSAVKAVVGYHGAFNFLEPVPRRWTRWSSVGELLGCAVPQCWERARLASPLSYVSLGDAPFFIVHGTADSTVPFTQSTLMDSTLRTLRIPVEFVPLPHADHGGPAFVSEGMIGRVRDFLRRVFTATDESSVTPSVPLSGTDSVVIPAAQAEADTTANGAKPSGASEAAPQQEGVAVPAVSRPLR